ncbi:structural maintenance of chromosomes protein 4 [Lineolata rhizophorae]|uniref:Structural maintenance of chromosomes protein n=1 Tax=Lineolata rhizophorae TaxID=578093 RepID=A0A6A6P6V3_9PEZI|nr:structural maintenance of chromosomes protein 4 [Lineolata rhizophorae]
MSTASPTRPSRRAAAASRRKLVISDDEDDSTPSRSLADTVANDDNDEEEFTPAPQKSPTRRRRTAAADAVTPHRAGGRTRRAPQPAGESVMEPSQVFSPPPDTVDASAMRPESPTKKKAAASPRKGGRKTSARGAASARQSRAAVHVSKDAPDLSQLPTPQASQSPEPASQARAPSQQLSERGSPLADITDAAVNEQSLAPADKLVTNVDPRAAVLEKPIDIVVRTRNNAMPASLSQEPGPPKSRIVITYLTLTNFKSYAGKQEVGPFHASFSSVVGPNGSGKSNVIDSLLFVFGFRASKMRQGKISALIHNSAAFPDLEYCEVEVKFQEVKDLPTGGHEIIPNSCLSISRRAFKNNQSKYYINGRESNFTEVTTLLRGRGVDLDHKRFLILQGEVESIAQMKPKAANEHDDGLLEYLEDIIGTSKYKTPIEEAAAETETLNDVCLEKSNRVQHVEKERNSLEEKKNKALAYIRDENELAMKQSALYQVYVEECNDNLQVMQEAMMQVQAALDEEVRKHEGNEEGIKALEKQYKADAKEYERMEKATQAMLKELAKKDKESVKIEEKKKFLAGKQKKLEKQLENSKFAVAESQTLGRQCADDIEHNAAQIAQLEEEMKVEEKELANIRDSMKGKTQGISDQIAVKQKSLEPWNAKINQKHSAIAVAQSELDILKEKDNAGANATAQVQAKIEEFNETREAKRAELEECKQHRKELEAEAKRVEESMEELAQKEPSLKSKLSGARQKADEARASLSATQTQGNVLTGLMRLKESGRINGFHGRLGNLGAIDQKYDVAISTACPSLDNLVVDTVEVGQQCIDYLRKNSLGRANFILLDRLPRRDLSPIQTPENVPRLFDLVKPKHDRFLPAFFSVLQNTLVANDLAQANRIAYGAKRWRVVTLDGQLIDKSGTMTGGGTRVARGAMSAKLQAADVTKDQVARLEVDREALEKAFAELQEEQRSLDAQMRSLVREQIPQAETAAQKLVLELDSVERNITDAEKRIRELQAEKQPSKADRASMVKLEKNIAAMEEEVNALRAEMAGVEEEIKALQDKIMEIGGVRLRSQKAKVDGLRDRIETLTEAMSTAEVGKAKAEKQRVKHEKAQMQAEEELESLAAEMEKVDQEINSQTKDASGSKRQAEEAQDALETKKDELQALKAELDTKTAELNETRGVEIEIRNKLEENQKVLTENQRRLRHWQDKLSKLGLQNVSDLGEEQGQETLPTYSRDELEGMDKSALKDEIEELEAKTQNANVELGVLSEYRRRVEEHATRSSDLVEAVTRRDTAKKRCDDLRRLRLEGFMEGFSAISLRLKEMYQMITMGGNAELELVDSLDPFAEGILFSVMPPKKSWKNISNLSGGEKTLSSLALVFALHHYKPTPLYVMDEIDAALDFRNVSIVASYIKERTKNAQFIVISLRNNMFELASRLVGVYKVNHMTKSVTVENRDYITQGSA